MKKFKKIIIIILVLVIVGVGIYFLVRDNTPIDDTKKLYISCESISDDYEVYNNEEINFAENNDTCSAHFEVRNIERNYIKLNSNLYFYKIDGNGEKDDSSLSNEIYVNPDASITLLSKSKNIKFVFTYK